MALNLRVDPADALPLWRQIADGMAHLVAAQVLAPGAPVPSVRELARELRVNPATVVRAYQELVDAGFLVTRRGDATYVAERPPVLPAGERSRRLQAAAERLALTAVQLGADDDQAIAALRAALVRLRDREGVPR